MSDGVEIEYTHSPDGVEIGCAASVVGPFRKSGNSPTADACVAVARLDNGGRAVAHSRHLGAARLHFTAEEWSAFVAGVRAGEFD